MPRRQSTFKQIDVTKAVKGVVAAGVIVRQVEIDPAGKIVIIAGVGEPLASSTELDRWMASHAGHA
jgi:hypothetical protein